MNVKLLSEYYKKPVKRQLLFHGSRMNDPQKIIKDWNGLDLRVANAEGVYGPGLYFHEKLSYSTKYAYVTN